MKDILDKTDEELTKADKIQIEKNIEFYKQMVNDYLYIQAH